MITREQVADLRPGDVVEIRDPRWPEGSVIRGPVYRTSAGFCVAGEWLETWAIRSSAPTAHERRSLTVISRAPRPLYVNHDRTKVAAGDVVRDADDERNPLCWSYWSNGQRGEWQSTYTGYTVPREKMPARLRLLVDGETGQVVP